VKATVVGHDPYYDVAVLKAENGTFHPIEQGDVEKVKVGSFVLGLANPFNQQAGATSGIVTGVGSKLRRRRGPPLEDIIVTDARLNPGYSGGPLVDGAGKMIGLNVAVIWSRGIAIPVNRIQRIVEQLMKEGLIKRSYLGITFQSISLPTELSKQSKIDQEGGAIIFSVESDSPAKKAGLALGDVIIKFDDKPVESAHDLPRVLTDDYIEKTTKLTILRGEKLKELTVTPVAKEPAN
jgi:S1-C subfamily serine protease